MKKIAMIVCFIVFLTEGIWAGDSIVLRSNENRTPSTLNRDKDQFKIWSKSAEGKKSTFAFKDSGEFLLGYGADVSGKLTIIRENNDGGQYIKFRRHNSYLSGYISFYDKNLEIGLLTETGKNSIVLSDKEMTVHTRKGGFVLIEPNQHGDTNKVSTSLRLSGDRTSSGRFVSVACINGDTSNKNNMAFYTSHEGVTTEKMRIDSEGNIGIGTNDPGSKLAVNGTIMAKKVKVTLSDWSDYVFKKDYQLRPLDSIEKFIKKNKHLPDVPSEKEVKKNGLDMSEMIKTQMKKIEELTLYLIEQNKKMIDQDKKIYQLNEKIEKLEVEKTNF